MRLAVLGVMSRPQGQGAQRPLRRDGEGPWRTVRDETGKHRLPRVLIVDEYRSARELYAWSLRAAGWSVIEVDGTKALLAASVFEPDVIVVDLGRNVAAGIASALQFRRSELTAHTPTVLCSAVEGAASTERTHEPSEDGVLRPRPYSPEELRTLLEELIAGSPRPGGNDDGQGQADSTPIAS